LVPTGSGVGVLDGVDVGVLVGEVGVGETAVAVGVLVVVGVFVIVGVTVPVVVGVGVLVRVGVVVPVVPVTVGVAVPVVPVTVGVAVPVVVGVGVGVLFEQTCSKGWIMRANAVTAPTSLSAASTT
jgi:hypothetical protein